MRRGTSHSLIGRSILVEQTRYLFCFSSANRHGVVKQSFCVSQALVDLLLEHSLPGRRAQAARRIENFISRTNSCLGRCNLHGAIAGQPSHRMQFIESQFAGVNNHFNYCSKRRCNKFARVIACLAHYLLVTLLRANESNTFHHALDFRDCDFNGALCSSEAILNTGRCQGAFDSFIRFLLLLADKRDIESNHYGAARSNCGRYIPEVLGGTCFSRNNRPHPEHYQEPNRKQQPDECQLRDFPRALHASPDLDFLGIVARRAAGISRRGRA